MVQSHGERNWVVDVQDLSKFYGSLAALSRVCFRVAKGEFFAITGHNGAGKTTLLRILATLSRPSSGSVWVKGSNVATNPEEVRGTLGFLAHTPALYEDLTGRENLAFFASLHEKNDLEGTLPHALDSCGLLAWGETKVRYFSHGMKKRLALARLMLIDPDLLLLDEPHAALDEQGVLIFKDFLTSFKKRGGSAIIATHNLPLVSSLCNRVLTLSRGKMGSMETLTVAG
jgi:heme ABC exporter ATP-binding subunit CcmA